MTKMRDTEHGVAFSDASLSTNVHVEVIATDPKHGLWLLVGTGHDALEVRVTPAGRKVTASPSRLRPPLAT